MANGQPTHDDATVGRPGRAALEEALARAEGELRQARRLDALGRVAGSIGHDLNNLLMVVNFQAERLEEELGADHAAVRELVSASERACTLVDRLLTLRARETLEVGRVDVNAAVRRVVAALGARLPDDVAVRWELDAALGETVADARHVEQIVQQLVLNALDAMPGGGTLTLSTTHVRADRAARAPDAPGRGAWVLLEVADTGEGMDERTLRVAPEPFVTTRRDDAHEGLGLSTVAALVRQWHGALRLRSAPGEGTAARVFLPRAAEEPRPGSRRAGAPVVLVVDREPVLRRLVRETLSGRGYEVLEAPDAGAALRTADRQDARVDLLLVDALVAERDVTALRERLARARRGLATVTMTSDDGNGRAGPTLHKPFTVSALLATVGEAIHEAAT